MLSNRILKITFFLLVALMLILNASGNIESIDGLGSLNMARSFVYTGEWNVAAPEYNIGMGVAKVGDKYFSFASKGYAFVLIPAVWITKIIYNRYDFRPVANFPLESDYLLTFLSSFVNPILGFLVFVLFYFLLKKIIKNDYLSLWLSIVMMFSTNLTVLSKHSYVHILFVLLVLSIFYSLIRRWYVAVLLFSVLLKYSYNTSFALPILSIYTYQCLVLNNYWKNKLSPQKYRWNILLLIVATFVLFFIGCNLVGLNPSNIRATFTGEGTRSDLFQGLWGQLFSPGRSLFVYSPVLILAFYLSVRRWNNIYSKLFIVFLFLTVSFYSLFDIWHGELSYGPRYLATIIPFGLIVIGVNWSKVNKLFFTILVGIGLYVQLVGSVIPYQVQYPEYNFLNISSSIVKNRQDQFDYWSLGEFIPRFSPPYLLKRVLITRLLSLKDIFVTTKLPLMILGGNVMLPDSGYRGRGVVGNFYLYATKDLTINSLKIVTDRKYKSLLVCNMSGCKKADFKFNLNKGDYLKIDFGNNEKYTVTDISINSEDLDINNYFIANTDRFVSRNSIVDYQKSVLELKDDWWYVGAVKNLTPDFWWVKTMIYQNLPNVFRFTFYGILVLTVTCLMVIGVICINKRNEK